MYKKGKRLTAGILALVLVWNSLGVAGTYTSAAGISDRPSAEISQQSGEDAGEQITEELDNVTEQDGSIDTTEETVVPEQEEVTEETAVPDADSAVEEGTETGESEEEAAPQDVEENEAVEDTEVEELIDEQLETYQAGEERLPDTLEEMLASGKKKYTIETYADVKKLCEFSQNCSFEGYTFSFALRNNKYYAWDFTTFDFTGLGSKEYPFRGRLEEYYDITVTFTMKRPLFNYLGSGASVKNFIIKLQNATSGIADYYVAYDNTQVRYDNVVLSGTVLNNQSTYNDGVAGALYGTVLHHKENNPADPEDDADTFYNLVIDGKGLDLTSLEVCGLIAGGYVGRVTGNIKVEVSDASNLAKRVYTPNSSNSVAVGGVVGKLDNGSLFEVTKETTVNNTVEIVRNTNGKTVAVGGLIGLCEEAEVKSDNKVTKKSNMLVHSSYTGGYIGHAKNAKIEICYFQLDGYVRLYGNYSVTNIDKCAGGVIGFYESDSDHTDASLKISYIGISSQKISSGTYTWVSQYTTYKNNAGGIAGWIQAGGGSVNISHLDSEGSSGYAYLPSLQYATISDGTQTTYMASGATGGIAGRVFGKDILVEDITLRFTSGCGLAGTYAGGIFAYVESNSKMDLQDITMKSFFLTYVGSSYGYSSYNVGGLLGSVFQGSMIRLNGKIDLQAINYNSFGDWYSYRRGNRGYVAGSQQESLIYLEDGASIVRNAYATSTNTTQWYDNSIWESGYWTSESTSPGAANYGYVMDDIGTYGGVYKNVKVDGNPVIQFDTAKVTGAVTKSGTAYQLGGDADALRMAIALGTFDASTKELRFGTADCFGGTGINANTLLAADYEVTDDINLGTVGVYSLVRNDGSYGFSGTMTGKKTGGKPVITLAIASRQAYGGLFRYLDGSSKTVAFKDLELQGYLYYNQQAGGIAPEAAGSVSLDNVDIKVRMKTYSNTYYADSYCYGGVIGKYTLGNGTFEYKNATVAPVITNVRAHQTVGGLIGCLLTPNQKVEQDNITISNVTVSSQISTAANLNYNMGWFVHAKVGGLIAYINYQSMRPALNNYTSSYSYLCSANNAMSTSDTSAKINLDRITVDGALIACTSTYNSGNVRATGGLLGYEWDSAEINVAGSLKVVNSEIKSMGHVGGLITTLGSSKLDATADGASIELDGLKMSGSLAVTAQTFCGFLVGDGRYALITLKDAGYTIHETCSATQYSNFDEIVGVTNALADNYVNSNGRSLNSDYKDGGIVNIILPDFKTNYTTYKNKVWPSANQYTRYYYNLFDGASDKQVKVTGGKTQITKEEDLMLWQVYHYSNQYVQRFLKTYFDGTPVISINATATALNMTGYSYYPITVSGGSYDFNNTTLILDGETIENSENADSTGKAVNKRVPSSPSNQHYMMHAGLFYNTSGTVAINGTKTPNSGTLTLQGTVTRLDIATTSTAHRSGAVISGNNNGTTYLNHITCDGIRVANYSNETYCSLLVSNVVDKSTLYMNGMTTTKAYKDNYPTTQKLAASALIATVGNASATNVHVYFQNMQVGGVYGDSNVYTPGSLSDEENRTRNYIFKWASFIYSYDSLDNSDTNTSFGLYTFTKADRDAGRVTYGDELRNGVDYAQDATHTTLQETQRDDALKAVITDAQLRSYLPYVCITKTILVNPKSGDLTEGCGTYEDPYVITNNMQFIMLYAYLGGGTDNTIFSALNDGHAWTVNQIGQDDGRCLGQGAHVQIKYSKDNAGFPSRDALRQAYYRIGKDLNFSSTSVDVATSDLNEYVIMSDFSGLGTQQYPFSGVIVGKDNTTDSIHTITLPASDNDWDNYGFIQYMKGAVVKDITIKVQQTIINAKGEEQPCDLKINGYGSGGGVAATVLGGDNIIDNVTVDISFRAKATTVMTGGYVGRVKAGSVIVRNIKADHVKNYKVKDSSGNELNKKVYYRNSQVIGWVEDGCIICEDQGTSGLLVKALNEELSWPLSYSFPMLNGDYLKSQCETKKIEITGDQTDGFTIQINNAAQLEIAAMALNSGAFSIYDSTESADQQGNRNHIYAYDHSAICRKAKYDKVGCGKENVEKTDDCKSAIENDDSICYFPYVYQYMTITGSMDAAQCKITLKEDGSKTYSCLNWYRSSSSDRTGIAVTKYELVENGEYDLSGFENSFRGFGELYDVETDSGITRNNPSRFRANFNGNGAKVTIDMTSRWDTSPTSYYSRNTGVFQASTGMFNDLNTDRQAGDGFTIKNLKIVNSKFAARYTSLYTNTAYSYIPAVGALAGKVKGKWTFENISFEQDEGGTCSVEGYNNYYSHTGGLVGMIEYYYTSSAKPNYGDQKIIFKNCQVKGFSDSDGQRIALKSYSYLGGLVGYVQGYTGYSYTYFGEVEFDNCKVWNTDLTLQQTSQSSRIVGGFVGKVGDNYNSDNVNVYYSNPRSYGRVTITSDAYSATEADRGTKTNIKNTRIRSESNSLYAAGGLVGMCSNYGANATNDKFEVNGVVINNLRIDGRSNNTSTKKYGIGGIAGTTWVRNLEITNVAVENSALGAIDVATGEPKDTFSPYDRLPTGGLVGVAAVDTATIKNSEVESCDLESYTGAVGGLIGDCQIASLTMDTVTVKKNTTHAVQQAVGGMIGINSYYYSSYAAIWNLKELKVEGCKVYSGMKWKGDGILDAFISASDNYAAGGILGRTTGRISPFNVSNIYVGSVVDNTTTPATESGSSIVGVHAGGFIGYLSYLESPLVLAGNIFIGCKQKENASGDMECQQDSDPTVIYACRNAGGLYGLNCVNNPEKSKADIQIRGVRIGAYYSPANTSYYAAAGGVAGRRDLYKACTYDNLTVQNCVIVGNSSIDARIACGGIYGIQRYGDSGNNNTAKAYLYAPVLKNNNIGYAKDVKSLDQLAKLNQAADIMLLYGESGSSLYGDPVKIKTLDAIKSELSETTVGHYAVRIGNFIGVHGESTKVNMYILHPTLEYDTDFEGTHPVIDVGNLTYSDSNYNAEYGYGYPYAWRQWCHIVYLDSVIDDESERVAEALQLSVNGKKKTGYLFSSLKTQGNYAETKTGQNFLDMYKLHVRMEPMPASGESDTGRWILKPGSDTDDKPENRYYYDKVYSTPELKVDGEKLDVVYIDGVTPQTAIDSIVGILTNMGGVVKPSGSTVTNDILTITARKAQIDKDGKITACTGTASLNVSNKYIQNTQFTYDEAIYADSDTAKTNPIGYTITLLTLKYGWTGADGEERAEVIYLPVFVVERINFYSDLRIMEGENYSLTDAKDDTISYTSEDRNIKISHNSTYTLFAEMAYSSGRTKEKFKNYQVDKVLTFEENKGNADDPVWSESKLPVGLRLTLVDVASGTPYYYTVEDEGNDGTISFEAFKKADGTTYVLKKVSEVGETKNYQYRDEEEMLGKEFGLEQFFIYVDSSQVKNMKNLIYRIRVDTDNTGKDKVNNTDKGWLNFIDRTETEGIQINWAPGLTIGFYDKTENREMDEDGNLLYPDAITKIDGKIGKNEKLTIDTRIAITADAAYWNEKETQGNTYIDSINNGKYLDVAVYLYDSAGEKIAFPASTTVTWKGSDDVTESQTITQESVIYGYKDWGGTANAFKISQVTGNMTDAVTFQIPDTTTTVSNECHLELSFETANLIDYIGNNYSVVVELRRTSDPAYPLGGDVVDITKYGVSCVGNKEYAVALNVKDNVSLGINTYNESGYDYQIPFTTKLDFSSWIVNNRDEDIKACADKYYQVTYRLKRKVTTATGYKYESVDTADAAEKLNKALKLELLDKQGEVSTTEELTLMKYNGEWVYQITKEFSANQIKDGDGADKAHIIAWDARLCVNTEDISLEEFSNYQLEVTILPYDKKLKTENNIPTTDVNTTENPSWSDFFIFTIAKLKKDI